jgi:hypothetical protein
MATFHCEVYDPPKKGMPFLAVGAIGNSLQFAHAARTRKEAEKLLSKELKILEEKASLRAAYGKSRGNS